ncbi:hypothetical protein BKA80DRAFT_273706 [Phyllosticta citrichinensis]
MHQVVARRLIVEKATKPHDNQKPPPSLPASYLSTRSLLLAFPPHSTHHSHTRQTPCRPCSSAPLPNYAPQVYISTQGKSIPLDICPAARFARPLRMCPSNV